ncbi:MAG TPA: hypothetical protein VEW03_11040 [Longimicrobiaceae bacterium]|nr:hypothetical protein [Longimicrobiaceae bacterium]
MPASPFRALAAVLCSAGLAACPGGNAGGGARDALLSSAPPPSDRACRISARPQQLPAAAALVEGEPFSAETVRLWTAAGRPAGYVLLSMGYDREGLNVRRAVLEHTVSRGVADSVQKLVFAHRRRQEQTDGDWGVRLRVEMGDAPVMRVGRREECSPRPRDRRDRVLASGFDLRESAPAPGRTTVLTGSEVAWIHVRISDSGLVTDAWVERSPFRGSWERPILNLIRNIEFLPALEDGIPVPGETTIPVRLPATR